MSFMFLKKLFPALVLLAAALVLLAGCADTPSGTALTPEEAVDRGYLFFSEPEEAQGGYQVAVVERRTLLHINMTTVSAVYLTQRELRFSRNWRQLEAVHVRRGDRVQAGDVLAELIPLDPQEAERIFLERESLRIALERFERDFIEEYSNRQVALALAEEALHSANDDEWPRMALYLAREEVRFEQFLMSREQTREQLTNRLRDIDALIAGDQIIAPFDGVILFAFAASRGANLGWQQHILTIASEESLFFGDTFNADVYTLWGGNAVRYTYGDIVAVTMSRIGDDEYYTFYAKVVSDPRATGSRTHLTYLLAPVDREALLAQLDYMDIDLAMPSPPRFEIYTRTYIHNRLAIPTRAIETVTIMHYGGFGIFIPVVHHHVYLYENGVYHRQNIVPGITCITSGQHLTEVIDGLYKGQEVIIR